MRPSRALVPALCVVVLTCALILPAPATAAPDGQMVWGVHISLAPTWFDPAETPGMITPFMIMYALHDAVVKPMPGQPKAPSLSESWTVSRDGLVYEFVLRKGARFHNGEPVTAEDVKFSFDRYRGTSARALKDQVAAVEVVDPQRVRFRLKRPWPDFLTFYSSTTGAGWIVPKKYVEQVGDEGYKKLPIGAGPYRFVSFTPGVELVFEAFEQYWRKTPSVKRLVFRVIPDETTRLAALKRGEVDIVYSIRGELADELKRSPGLGLKAVVLQGTFWLYFADQWDAKSPWHDRRVRQAASLAINRPGINEALTLGFSKLTGSIIPTSFEYYWQPPRRPSIAPPRRSSGRRRVSERLRVRRVFLRRHLRESGRGRDQRPASRRHPLGAPATRAGRLLRRLQREEVQEPDPGVERGLRQRGDPTGGVRRRRRRLCVRDVSGHRRPLPGAGRRQRPQAPREHSHADPAARARQGRVRADLAAGLHQRPGPAGRGVGPRPHRRPRLLRPLRGRDAETLAARECPSAC
jgi:hypothetical protein